MFLLSPHSIVIYVLVWSVVILWNFVQTQTVKAFHFKFSVFNYYVMMLPFVLAAVVASFDTHAWTPLFYFIGFGIAGVIGESLVSIWWRLYFSNRFWVYKVETVDHAYTSWLNFIPWAVGGTIYFNTLIRFLPGPFGPPYGSLWSIALILVIVLFVLQKALLTLVRPIHRYRAVTLTNFVLFFWPIAALVVALALLYGPQMYVLALVFGIVATAAEYLFGKSTELFISKKLWTYTYLSVDRGHFTPLSIPLFALGGFYFWSVAELLQLVIK